ncbi:acetyl-CoA synthetase-like protein [Suillus brevipes Sb2]|nr:acetyl-CoA synthetase-like protein [Suillus brevipes Sb2]
MYYKSLFPELPKVPESNVHHLLFNRPDQREWPDYTLLVNVATGQRRSFKEFVERVRDGATALGADVTQGGLGLRPENGDIVGILSENCPDYIALVHSLLAITVPFALLSSYSTPYELKHANSLAQATRIFTSPSLLQLALTSGLPADRIYLLEGESNGYTSYDQLISSARKNGIPRLPVRHATKDTLAYLIYSSGTSGLPKAIMTSHGNIATSVLSTLVNGMEMAKIRAPPVLDTPEGLQVVFSVLPLYHAVGLFTTSFFSFLNPSTIVMLPKWDINKFFDSIPKYHITAILLVPSLLHQFVHHPRFKTAEMNSVTMVGSGAAYLPPQLADQVCARFPDVPRVTEGYGLSEFTIAVAMKPIPGMLNGRAKNKPGSAGILAPGVEARIVRPDGSLAGPNEPGELLIRGGSATLGYKGNDKATRETFVDGWVRTGDRMRFDEDEVLFFEDRTKDTLKISGMQVSPNEIENTILAQPDKLITDVSVAGVSGGRTSDERIPRAWVVLSPAGAALGEKEVVSRLNAWVQEHLSRYKWLRGGIGIVEAIPKSPTGKVLRRVLVEGYEKEVQANAKL